MKTEMQIPEFLIEMSKQMNSDPSRCTAHPFWQVRCKRYLPTEQGYNESHIEVYGYEGLVYRSIEPLSELVDYLLDNHEEFCKSWAIEEHDEESDYSEVMYNYFDLDCDRLPEELKKICVQEVEEIVTTHLTQSASLAFIKRKQHDYPKLYTHVESAYWSPQLRELQDWIKSLTDNA